MTCFKFSGDPLKYKTLNKDLLSMTNRFYFFIVNETYLAHFFTPPKTEYFKMCFAV